MVFYKKKERKSYYVKSLDGTEERDIDIIALKIKDIIEQHSSDNQDVVFLCIGSDRFVGDALGPLVGTMLMESEVPYRVYGTLQNPVHAFNLKSTIKKIHKKVKRPLVISIDACIGVKEKVGHVVFKEGPLLPGKAVQQMLPEVGDYHFLGIVNYADSLPAIQFLNDTRLYTVMNLARTIVKIITSINATKHGREEAQ